MSKGRILGHNFGSGENSAQIPEANDASQVTPEAALARILQKSEAFFEIAKTE